MVFRNSGIAGHWTRKGRAAMDKLPSRKAFLAFLSVLIVAAAGSLGAADFLYTWDPSPDAGLNGYRIYQRTEDAPYELLAEVDVADLEDPAHPGYRVTDLQPGSVYHFAAASVKASGEESALSNQPCITNNGQVVECQDKDQNGTVVFINCFISALNR
jgi:hypothetical protein